MTFTPQRQTSYSHESVSKHFSSVQTRARESVDVTYLTRAGSNGANCLEAIDNGIPYARRRLRSVIINTAKARSRLPRVLTSFHSDARPETEASSAAAAAVNEIPRIPLTPELGKARCKTTNGSSLSGEILDLITPALCWIYTNSA